MTDTYLIIGGAGRTGRRVADLLAREGYATVIASRRPGGGGVNVDLSRDLDPDLLAAIDGVVISVEPPAGTAGAEAVMHRGIANVAALAAAREIPVVLISQIYINRADEHPEIAGIIRARAAGEQAVRDSGAPYTIVRPAWLTDAPGTGVRLEQGDTGDGTISRLAVAEAAVAALLRPEARAKTFELYDGEDPADWPALFASLRADSPAV
ncbi:MAG: NAD(P)H-binding protein [Streptosporangiaceae bacterium]|jgi:uncharacterized protein YbjT (DUF2867 family)